MSFLWDFTIITAILMATDIAIVTAIPMRERITACA
jgi:hypothetical protein